MARPSPQQTLEDFFTGVPSWFRKLVQGELLTPHELKSYAKYRGTPLTELIREYERLLQKIPEQYQIYRDRKQLLLARFLPSVTMGRPRMDEEASEAERLHTAGTSWNEIARLWGTPEENVDKEGERIRKLVGSRRNPPPGKKSD